MSPEVKHKINDIANQAHRWMTLIGFPVLIILIGDMYVDFKRVRDNDIRQDEQISYNKREVEKQDRILESLTNYIYRGIKN